MAHSLQLRALFKNAMPVVSFKLFEISKFLQQAFQVPEGYFCFSV